MKKLLITLFLTMTIALAANDNFVLYGDGVRIFFHADETGATIFSFTNLKGNDSLGLEGMMGFVPAEDKETLVKADILWYVYNNRLWVKLIAVDGVPKFGRYQAMEIYDYFKHDDQWVLVLDDVYYVEVAR